MSKIFSSILIIFLLQTVGFAQDICVQIKTEDIPMGKKLILKAEINPTFTDLSLKFIWKLSTGFQQTSDKPILETITNTNDYREIKISLKVEGFPPNCLENYEKNIFLIPPPKPIIDYDYFSNNGSWNDEKSRLLHCAKELKEDENLVVLIQIATQNTKSRKLALRKSRIIQFLTKNEKIDKNRIRFVITKSNREQTQYWIVSKEVLSDLKIQN